MRQIYFEENLSVETFSADMFQIYFPDAHVSQKNSFQIFTK